MTIVNLWNLQTESAADFEAVIRYIYTSQYLTAKNGDWQTHLNRARVAWKFGVQDMEDAALAALEQWFGAKDVRYILKMLNKDHEYDSEKLQDRVKAICEKYKEQLEYEPGYALWTKDEAIMERCLQRLADERELISTRGRGLGRVRNRKRRRSDSESSELSDPN